jgi:hypothetical protein
MYLLYIFPPELHNDFIVLTSLTHPREIHLVVLQIGKTKDLSAPLRITSCFFETLREVIEHSDAEGVNSFLI